MVSKMSKKTKKINWSCLLENSSSIDAISEFANGMSARKAIAFCWHKEAKSLFYSLERMGALKARKAAKRWLRKNFD